MRIDYVFASDPLAPHLTDCRVLSEMAAYDASDHVPVLAELNY